MIGICIEAGITCPSCESYVPLNALVPSLRCSGCGKDLELSLDVWKTVLEDSLKQAPFLEEGEGSSSTIFGSYNYKVLYGRLAPRYDDTKDDIDIDMLLEKLDEGRVLHPGSGAPTGVRRMPEQYHEAFMGVLALIGEDPSQLPGTPEGLPLETALSGPIAFQCPSCAGSLIVDGASRSADCRFCQTQVHLPDDLWFRLHPVKKEKRWFLLFDEFQRFDLEGNLLSLWGRTEEKQGFWGRMKMWFGSRRRAPHFSDTSDYPVRTRDSDIRLAIGQDGSVYMLSYTMLLRLDCSGKKVYLAELPCNYTTGRPVVNASGEAFVLSHGDHDRIEVLSVSPDGTTVSVAVASTLDGGPVEDGEILALSPEGRFSLLGYCGKWTDAENRLSSPCEGPSTQAATQP